VTRAALAVTLGLAGLAASGCATAARPAELANAEQAYARARGGVASTYATLDLEAARGALDRAERAFASKDLDATRDLAYVAERRAELAEARAEEARDLAVSSPPTISTPQAASTTTSTTSTTTQYESSQGEAP
jgi:hypothetical protein